MYTSIDTNVSTVCEIPMKKHNVNPYNNNFEFSCNFSGISEWNSCTEPESDCICHNMAKENTVVHIELIFVLHMVLRAIFNTLKHGFARCGQVFDGFSGFYGFCGFSGSDGFSGLGGFRF